MLFYVFVGILRFKPIKLQPTASNKYFLVDVIRDKGFEINDL